MELPTSTSTGGLNHVSDFYIALSGFRNGCSKLQCLVFCSKYGAATQRHEHLWESSLSRLIGDGNWLRNFIRWFNIVLKPFALRFQIDLTNLLQVIAIVVGTALPRFSLRSDFLNRFCKFSHPYASHFDSLASEIINSSFSFMTEYGSSRT